MNLKEAFRFQNKLGALMDEAQGTMINSRRRKMNTKKLPPLSQLERVEQSLFSERLDEMLDRIEQEETAYMITENGEDKAILCPYWWFEENEAHLTSPLCQTTKREVWRPLKTMREEELRRRRNIREEKCDE